MITSKLEIKFSQLECNIIFINLQKLIHEIVGQGAHIYKCSNTVDQKNINTIGEVLKGYILKKIIKKTCR